MCLAALETEKFVVAVAFHEQDLQGELIIMFLRIDSALVLVQAFLQ